MSLLDELKLQAQALQEQNQQVVQSLTQSTVLTEDACRIVWPYLAELAPQLSVICPDGPQFSVDGKSQWPAMQLTEFRVDSRRKFVRNQDLYASMSMGWGIVPRVGPPADAHVSVNFPPELKRAEERMSAANLAHHRSEIRHPETEKLQAIRFDFKTELRGSLMVTPDHDNAAVAFRLNNATGFRVLQFAWPAAAIDVALLDDMTRLILGRPSAFAAAAA